ncbi:MAG: hypothetical protein ACLR8P_05015 [Clostridium fessum]
MDFFRKMSFADSTGDAIPFYHEGKYHIFSLTSPTGTTVYPARLRTTLEPLCFGGSGTLGGAADSTVSGRGR